MDEFTSRAAVNQIIAAQCGECADACLEFDGIQPDCNQCLLHDAKKAIESIPAADVRPVVTCSDCKWWTKQEASLQGRCELLKMYPTGTWFCANGKRE